MSNKICLKQETFDHLLSMSLSNCQVSNFRSQIEPKFVLTKEKYMNENFHKNVYENYQRRIIYPIGTLWNKTSQPVSLQFINIKIIRDNLINLNIVNNPRFLFRTRDGSLWPPFEGPPILNPDDVLMYEFRYDIEDPTIKDLPIKEITISFTILDEKGEKGEKDEKGKKGKNIYPVTLNTSYKNYVLTKNNKKYELKIKPPSIKKPYWI